MTPALKMGAIPNTILIYTVTTGMTPELKMGSVESHSFNVLLIAVGKDTKTMSINHNF